MVGDRAHFHFLQLHHWPAVLNCSHNYHIAEDDQIKSFGMMKRTHEMRISYGFISILARLSSLADNHFCIWNSYHKHTL